MKKLKFLVSFGLRKRIRSKAFVIANVIVGLIILAITVLPSIISLFADESDRIIDGKIKIVNTSTYDAGDTDIAQSLVEGSEFALTQVGYLFQVEFIKTTDPSEIPDVSFFDTDTDAVGIIYIYRQAIDPLGNLNDQDNYVLKVEFYDKNMHPVLLDTLVSLSRNLQRIKYIMDHETSNPQLVADLVPTLIENPAIVEEEPMAMLSALAPILIVPIFILITFGVQAIGSEIIEEKSTKAIEIIIASVPPKTHFLSKIISISLFQFLQLFLYCVYGVIGVLINELIAKTAAPGMGSWEQIMSELDVNAIPVLLLVFVSALLGATIYSVLGAFIASLAINQEDYQQIQTPVMMLLMVAYFGSIFAGAFQSKEILLVFAYIPFFSPLVLPVMLAMGFLNWFEITIGLGILIGSILLIMLLVSPLYRASILSYDQSSLFKRIKNTIQTAKALKENQKLYEENRIE